MVKQKKKFFTLYADENFYLRLKELAVAQDRNFNNFCVLNLKKIVEAQKN